MIGGPSSAAAGSMTSTTRPPGATSSCSTTATSVSRRETPAPSAIFPSYNYMSDVTKRGEILGMDSTTFFGALVQHVGVRRAIRDFFAPAATPRSVICKATCLGEHTNYGLRAREELKLTQSLTAVAGIGWEATTLKGSELGLQGSKSRARRPSSPFQPTAQFQNTAPEFALLYRPNSEWQFRGTRRYWLWNAASRKPFCPCQRSERQQHSASDAEEPRLRSRFRLDAEQCAETQRDRLLRIFPQRVGHPGDSGKRTEYELPLQRAEVGASWGGTRR